MDTIRLPEENGGRGIVRKFASVLRHRLVPDGTETFTTVDQILFGGEGTSSHFRQNTKCTSVALKTPKDDDLSTFFEVALKLEQDE